MKVAGKLLKKPLAMLLVFLILFTMILPAYEVNAETYHIPITVKTADVRDAGTDSSIRAYLYSHEDLEYYDNDLKRWSPTNKDLWTELSSSANDHERGDCRTYYYEFPYDPWMLKSARVYHGGGGAASGWLPEYWEIGIPKIAGGLYYKTVRKTEYQPGWAENWLYKGDCLYLSLSAHTKRNITSDPVSSMTRGVLFSETDANNFSGNSGKEWGCYNNIPIQITDQYGTYNPYHRDDPPDPIKLEVDDRFENGTHYTFQQNNDSFTFRPEKALWDKMTELDLDYLTFSFEWQFKTRSTNNATRTSNVAFKRKVFRLANLSIASSRTEVVETNLGGTNYYFNKNYRIVRITANITNKVGANNTMLAIDFDATASLLKGNNPDGEKICDLDISRNGSQIIFTGIIPDNYTTGDDGIYLRVENAKSRDYVLAGNPNQYFSNYKVDTVSPVFSIVDENKASKDITNKWANVHKFNIISSEPMTGGVVTYKLYDENNQAVEIPNYSGSGGNSANGQVVPIGTDVLENGEVNLKLSQHTEGKYYMTIEGYDEAKNYGILRVDNILLDNKAPVATIKSITQKQETGRVKRIDFEF